MRAGCFSFKHDVEVEAEQMHFVVVFASSAPGQCHSGQQINNEERDSPRSILVSAADW